MRSASLSALAAVVVLAFAPAARAWVCKRTDGDGSLATGPSLSWSKRDLAFTLYSAGTKEISNDLAVPALRASFQVWTGVQGCSTTDTDDLQFTETPLSTTDRVGYDFEHPDANENLLIFRDDGWPIPGQTDVIALTTVTYVPLTGEILDADIEFNSYQFTFAVDGSSDKMDLMNAAVHEIGHYLGLAHSPVAGSTMQATGHLGETSKRDLACDDRDAIVFKYPAGQANGYCNPMQTDQCPAFCADTACGYCPPPDTLTRSATVSVVGSDDGRGGCSAAGAGPLAGVIALLALARRRRGARH